MGTIAKQLDTWIQDAGEAWSHGGAAVIWSLAFGADFERAWRECPRADYLVLLAAVGGAEHSLVQRALCRITRELVPLSPAQEAPLSAMQRVTESFMRSEPLPSKLELGQYEAAAALRDAEVEAQKGAKAVYTAAHERLDAVVAKARAAGDDVTDAVVHAFEHATELVALRAVLDASARRACTMHTLQAFFASLTVAKLAESLEEDAERISEQVDDDPELSRTVARYETIERRLYGSAAEVIHQSALARSYSKVTCDEVWQRCVLAAARARSDGPPKAGKDTEVLRAAVDKEVEEHKLAELSAYVERLRAALPFEDLDFEPHEETRPAFASMAEARATMRRGLAGALAAANELGDTTLPEAIPIALAILDAPGELDRSSLSPVMATVHERLAALFRAEGKRAGTRDGAQWLRLADQVEEDKRLFTEFLEESEERLAN